MCSIEKLDKNFAVRSDIGEEMIFYNCLETPFRVYGLIAAGQGFIRMPEDIAKTVNENVSVLFRNTAGGRVRFRTDSPRIAIRSKMANIGRMPHFALTGTAGFDLYGDGRFLGTFVPPFDIQDGYESVIALPGIRSREITIHFPLYSDVISLEIGLCTGASLLPAGEYRTDSPIVFYGSSITQGGCASRPGNCYENIISRTLGCDHINLGFSGGARGEETIASYIAGLPMCAFVYDYDYNAPSVKHFRDTHQRMFQMIRAKNPLLPVVMVSRPQPNPTGEEYERLGIVTATWQKALESGDKNVYFVDGTMMLRQFGGDSGTVDACHPNDLGFMCMANAIGAVLEKILPFRSENS